MVVTDLQKDVLRDTSSIEVKTISFTVTESEYTSVSYGKVTYPSRYSRMGDVSFLDLVSASNSKHLCIYPDASWKAYYV